MEELWELRQYLEQQRYPEALNLLLEMEEMSRDDKINKIYDFAEVLLLHLIKQVAEKRTTRSWELSIENSVRQIARINQRRKSGGVYLSETELQKLLAQSYNPALKYAALETFGGVYEAKQLAQMVNRAAIEQNALDLIRAYHED